mmetsp:Transcript_6635/g.11981  ORF Transcript_6635/g.11981 Transcript_6635/m.11981 type:complete len:303 (+) Transcript_6635:467-1375(+)
MGSASWQKDTLFIRNCSIRACGGHGSLSQRFIPHHTNVIQPLDVFKRRVRKGRACILFGISPNSFLFQLLHNQQLNLWLLGHFIHEPRQTVRCGIMTRKQKHSDLRRNIFLGVPVNRHEYIQQVFVSSLFALVRLILPHLNNIICELVHLRRDFVQLWCAVLAHPTHQNLFRHIRHRQPQGQIHQSRKIMFFRLKIEIKRTKCRSADDIQCERRHGFIEIQGFPTERCFVQYVNKHLHTFMDMDMEISQEIRVESRAHGSACPRVLYWASSKQTFLEHRFQCVDEEICLGQVFGRCDISHIM